MSDLPKAKTRPASNWSAIWVLPLIALVIGGWLGWRAYSQTGIEVQVRFESGEGIQANKTEVVYKGMSVGKVKALALDDEGNTRGVIATVEMNKDVQQYLKSSTRFWLVKPSVTLAGITGLETLVSGNYIAISPGEGEPARKFKALAEEPPLSDAKPGLHLTIKADRLGSLNRGSPVFYKQIQVGEVKSYLLSEDQNTVEIKVFIEPTYANLVRKHTRFWNASGISIDANLSGVKVRSESLASIVAGGIAFATPENRRDSPPTDPSLPFRLYEDFDAAQAGIRVKVKLSDFEGLQAGRTPVMYKGIQVGNLKALKVDPDLSSATAELTLDPLAEDYLVQGTQFWVVKPSISLAGITGLEALVKGNYIAVRPGDKGGAPQREFEARPKAPPLDLRSPGLHLVLFTENLGSLEVGSPILYKQVKVGSVQSYQFSRTRKQLVIGVHIEKEYEGLVNGSTRFWNASGVTLTGGLTGGIQVKSESLQSLMAGGIAFDTPEPNVPLKKRIPRFRLYADKEQATQKGTLISIKVDRADGLRSGTPIRFKGLDVGKVEDVDLSGDLQSVLLKARITEVPERIARVGSQFWVVKPELGLIKTANLETLVTGQYIEVQPAVKSLGAQTSFVALPQPPEAAVAEAGLSLVLSAARRGSLKVGVPVTYREVTVGKVTGYELGQTADRVLIHILIEPKYAPLVRGGTRFWNSSGFGIDIGLFKGATVRTESLETLIQGGIAFATPDGERMGSPARPEQTFPLFDKFEDEWLTWAPKIPLAK
ncbi:Paraquat-inducible protein B [Pseudomonas chlororaphis]|jgi:paraquat-inducible protein B|uniref:PqiB family protein n=1 Tax=Pseudomonas TaxID=286 RepID=UPI00087C09B4|nr:MULTISPECIES: MlaD family protein [Pseudomonas]AZD69426.1 Paraquat-inducible protein B [Pseudomonas chlororaphis subsp. aurantiaca]AZD75632.1 Paraquat-inducible protein B [Pseudomonas chlororaphis subsp. aurantiaca]QIT25261.1 MCE family protein [Pseudomonas chlororaphis subsp. aurantiaca]UUT20785.1 MlaD family protein [Pseudomonas sp. T8]WDH03372.1 MlaD family protein [Pseudomonas chlororaphis]